MVIIEFNNYELVKIIPNYHNSKEKVFVMLMMILMSASVDGKYLNLTEDTLNCYADYLKRNNLLETSFQSITHNDVDSCDLKMSAIHAETYAGLYKDFSDDSATCIVKNLEKSKYVDFSIKEQVIDRSLHLTKQQKDKLIKNIKKTQHSILENSKLSCIANKEFSTMFDLLLGDKTVENDDSDQLEDFCARKFVVDNNFIDNNVYNLNTNPQNINTTNIDCDGIMQKVLKSIESDLKEVIDKDDEAENKVKCIVEKYNANHYFEKLLAIIFLKELNPSEAQIIKEREKFIEIMINITKSIEDC